MIKRCLLAWMFLAGIAAFTAHAAPLKVYWTTNPVVATVPPPTGWQMGGLVGPIVPNEVFWVAFENSYRPMLKKYLRIEVGRAGGGGLPNLTLLEYDGFDIAGQPVPKRQSRQGITLPGAKRYQEFILGAPQPVWERFKYKSTEAAAATFIFAGWSLCAKGGPGFQEFRIDEGRFPPPPILDPPAPAQSDIRVFPRQNSVDTSMAPSFSFPPGSGTWTTQFVTVDPDGNPRPRGGVRWSTTGSGIVDDQAFSIGFHMNELQDDLVYDLYVYDANSNVWEQHALDYASGNVPSLGFYGLALLAGAVLLGGVVLLRRS